MKKSALFVLFLIIILASAGTFAYFYLFRKPAKSKGDGDGDDDDNGLPPTPGLVNIYVNSTIYNSINTSVQKYKQNAVNQGFRVNIINWSNPQVSTLKQNISKTYNTTGLTGVILIGRLPYAMGRYYETNWWQILEFPTDLYLMDLDGTWNDANGDGVYDCDPQYIGFEHSNGTGDWGPEIWLARIDPHSISEPAFNYINSIKDFFNRTFNLRNGTTIRPHKAMLFIDDDWSHLDWETDFTAYTGTQRNTYKNNSYTNSTNYMNNLTLDNYELVQLLTHSYPERHVFGPLGNGADGSIRYNDVSGNTTLPLFYMLYACFCCNYTQINNIGTHYLFTGGSTLTVVGSARSGGVDLYKPFYDALKQGKTFGEAFYLWFQNPEILKYNKAPLYYGMTILGDPLATIYMT